MLSSLVLLGACAEEPQPPTVEEFLGDPFFLEATIVRCSADRSRTRYRPECVNARQAVSILEAREDRARRAAFEAESAAKRAALRRNQEARAEARRRAEAAERQRREAEYLAQFGAEPPPDDDSEATGEGAQNAPGAVLPPPPEEPGLGPASGPVPTPGGNAPGVQQEAPQDIDSIREELQRRNDDAGG